MKKETARQSADRTNEPKKTELSSPDLATEYLANERTFLAWVRTGIAVITLGFGLAKVRTWLGETGSSGSPGANGGDRGESISLGIGMVLFGGILVVLAALRYSIVNQRIERGEAKADRWLIVLVTVAVVILTILTALYLLFGAGM
jgi:putative membrane protein